MDEQGKKQSVPVVNKEMESNPLADEKAKARSEQMDEREPTPPASECYEGKRTITFTDDAEEGAVAVRADAENLIALMENKNEQEPHDRQPRRIFLRFRTNGAPKNDEIMNLFYSATGLQRSDYFTHYQPREYQHTHIVVDVHYGSDKPVAEVDKLPHEVLYLRNRPNRPLEFHPLNKSVVKQALEFTDLFPWATDNDGEDFDMVSTT